MTELIQWRVYCITEQEWTIKWLPNGEMPVSCFNNNTHEINPESCQIINRTSISNVKIIEEDIQTGGYLRSEGFELSIPPDSTGEMLISWENYPVGILNCNILSTESHLGNIVDGIVGPNTTIGYLTSDSTSGSFIHSVSPTVLDNIRIGLEFLINGELIGEITGINSQNNTVTTDVATENDYISGTLVSGQRRIIKNFPLGYKRESSIGRSKIGTSYIPKGIKTKVIYKNTKPEIMVFNFVLEYLY